jgi:Janus/Ocnus family (Ocnus)
MPCFPAGLSMACEAFVNLPEVDIDADGRFKYILIRATDTKSNEQKMIVRGYKWANFHGRNYFYFIFHIAAV